MQKCLTSSKDTQICSKINNIFQNKMFSTFWGENLVTKQKNGFN